MAKHGGKLFSTEEALQKIFQDSSDSDEDYISEEEELFQHGIDPVIDNLDEEEDEDDTVPPQLSLVAKSGKSQPQKRNRHDEEDDEDWEPDRDADWELPQVSTAAQTRKKSKSSLQENDADVAGPLLSVPPSSLSSRARRSARTSPAATPQQATTSTGRRSGSKTPPVSTPAQPVQTPTTQRGDRWLEKDHPDSQPTPQRFHPRQPCGPTVDRQSQWSPFQLFKLFFNITVVRTLIVNTNKMAQRLKAAGKKFPWRPVVTKEFYTFLAIVIFCGLVRCPAKDDYWRKVPPYNFPFPASAMTRKRFNTIFWCLHLSDPDEDETNEQKKGSPLYDRLFKVKPLYSDILTACQACYHPHKQVSIDERMIATKARLGFKQYLPLKPTKWGIKMFVLADIHGYTWNYFIYEGKTAEQLKDGLGYSVVMRLLKVSLLGTGYQVFMDNFYTSPKLLTDLEKMRIMACGTMREGRRGFPATKVNKLGKRAKRGEIRWLRDEKLLFVQWMDTKQVTVASNYHQAYNGFKASRRMRNEDGIVQRKDVPIPDSVKDYNANMGGVDLSDALIGYYSVLHKTMKWYKKIFYHMVDIAVVNSFILHKQLTEARGETPMTQKKFREVLIREMTQEPPSQPKQSTATCGPIFPSGDSTIGRRKCVLCKNRTPVMCRKCNIPLCLLPKRNCYIEWHDKHQHDAHTVSHTHTHTHTHTQNYCSDA